MGEPSKSIWYHLGYALESASHGARSAREGRSEATALGSKKGTSTPERKPVSSAVDQLFATGTGVLGDRLFAILGGRRPGTMRLTRAALAGAGAGLALSLFRNGSNGTPKDGGSSAGSTGRST